MRKKMMKQLPIDEQPRERLLLYGEQSLATHELLAILLRTGTKDETVLQVARDMLCHFEDLYQLKSATIEELKEINGIGFVKAIEIKAAIELGFRLVTAQQLKLGKIISSQTAADYFMHHMNGLTQEHLVVLFLNTKHEIIQKKNIFIGSADRSIANPRDIYALALKYGATCILIAHNHPSGHPEPSHEDILFTKRLVSAGEMIGVSVLDHLIIGQKTYISLKERAIIN
ncbi:DNA repair protein RadC [Carnobacteriaceae bacterium zg-ZUI78]|nr:DNA repair protein RadC [Carnobacteriaceae bacterium zg-ZUI78]